MEVEDPLFKVFNDPIFVNWYGDKSFPLLAIGTETTGGFEKGLPVSGIAKIHKSNDLLRIYNNEIVKMGLLRIKPMPTLRENLAVCNVVRNVNSDIPLDVTRDDYKDDQTFGDAGGQGEEPATEVYKKIVNNAKWVLSKLLEGKNVYIHCNAGGSRSPTVIAKLIMDFLNVSLDEAIKMMKINAPKNPSGHDRIDINKFRNLLENVPETSDSSEKKIFLKRLSEKRETLEFLKKEGLSTRVIENEIEELKRNIEGEGREPEPEPDSLEAGVSYDEQGQPIYPKKAVFFDIDHTLMTASRDHRPGVKLEDLEKETIDANKGLKLITHNYVTDEVGSITQFTTDKIINMLTNLNKKNIDIYIVSNAFNKVPFEQILKKAGLDKNIIKNFDEGWNINKVNAIGEQDNGGAKKDEIARIIKENNYVPENVVFVDDTKSIVNTVATLGIKTVKVTDIVNHTLHLNAGDGEYFDEVAESKLLGEGNISTLYGILGISNQDGGRRKKTRNKRTKKGGGKKKISPSRRK